MNPNSLPNEVVHIEDAIAAKKFLLELGALQLFKHTSPKEVIFLDRHASHWIAAIRFAGRSQELDGYWVTAAPKSGWQREDMRRLVRTALEQLCGGELRITPGLSFPIPPEVN